MKMRWARAALGSLIMLAAFAAGGRPLIGIQLQQSRDANTTVEPMLYGALEFRSLGFSRGGRSTTVTGIPGDPLIYYFGSTGGGVWKTTDAGRTWGNISDAFFEAGSIGAIAVAPSDSNVIYVGTGSACPRGNVSPGIGIYKSVDTGRSWKHVGLRDAGQISRIAIHPTNPDLVYVAVLGNVFGASRTRGIFRSSDGGLNWENVLYVDDRTGASDLSMDATNPRILYAGMWTVERKPWTIDSGSMVGGIFKSTDGGATWTKLTNGLPTEVLVGKIAVTVSPARPSRVWAQVEAAGDQGGLYRSDDVGASWERVNKQRILQQRAWYYTHVFADPAAPDTVYALNTGFYKSIDGGRTFQAYAVPHGDNHDLWINPNNPRVMINANDGGVNVSFNGGESWTDQMGQPTAEIYRIAVDTRFPYRVYGAQQDNSTASVTAYGPTQFRGAVDFYPVGGGESGHIAVDPSNPNVVYAGSHSGAITRTDTSTRLTESVRAYPQLLTGQRALDMKYRVQWNAPIRISPHDANIVYHTSQYVHRTKDAGVNWQVISPDLTRNDKSKQDYSGGKGITKDSTTVEVYGTVFAFEESPHRAGLLWAGSDDGLVHVSQDDGKTWQNVTPREMPEWGCVNLIDLSAHDAGRAHIAVYKYRQNDFTPYIFQTNDFGKTWKRLTDGKNGIPGNHFVRVVREDAKRKGLLYAGTEFGMYISFDDGGHWQRFQMNLPVTPVTDLYVHPAYDDLVVSTQGRAFWVLDDLAVVRQIRAGMEKSAHLFKPDTTYREGMAAAHAFYYLPAATKDEAHVEILDQNGGVVYEERVKNAKVGLNRFEWNRRHLPPFDIPRGAVLWGGPRGGKVPGPKVVPGTYQVRLRSGTWSQTQTFEVRPDPRQKTTNAEYQEQLRVAMEVGRRIAALYDALAQVRDIKEQASQLGERMRKQGYGDDLAKAAKALSGKFTAVEGELTQLEGESGQDGLNFPPRLDSQFITLYGEVTETERRLTRGMAERFDDIKLELQKWLDVLQHTMTADVRSFNDLARSKGIAPIVTRRSATETSQP